MCQLQQRCCLRVACCCIRVDGLSWRVCVVYCCRPLLLNCRACRDDWWADVVLNWTVVWCSQTSSSSHPGAEPSRLNELSLSTAASPGPCYVGWLAGLPPCSARRSANNVLIIKGRCWVAAGRRTSCSIRPWFDDWWMSDVTTDSAASLPAAAAAWLYGEQANSIGRNLNVVYRLLPELTDGLTSPSPNVWSKWHSQL